MKKLMKICPYCNGSGEEYEGENEFLCRKCNGSCKVEASLLDRLKYIVTFRNKD